MGIRIHKRLGYALLDFATEPYKDEVTLDNRFNFNIRDYSEEMISDRQETVADFLVWWEQQKQLKLTQYYNSSFIFLNEIKNNANKLLAKYITFQYECGCDDVCLFTPISMAKEWYRYDDTIDYYEDLAQKDKNKEFNFDRYHILEGGIYPFVSKYINVKTGKTFSFGFYEREKLNKYVSSVKEDMWDSVRLPKDLVEEYGFETVKDVHQYFRLVPPDELLALCEFLNIFKDKNTVYDLKPILWTYWG